MTDTYTIGELAYDTLHRRVVRIAGPLELYDGIDQFHAHRCQVKDRPDVPPYTCYSRPVNLRKLEPLSPAKWIDIEMVTRGWNPTRTVGP